MRDKKHLGGTKLLTMGKRRQQDGNESRLKADFLSAFQVDSLLCLFC